MPARQFFAILQESRRLESWRYNAQMAELCDVAAIAICRAEYANDLRKSFVARAVGKPWRRADNTIKMDAKDAHAPKVLEAIFKQKAKLEGLT